MLAFRHPLQLTKNHFMGAVPKSKRFFCVVTIKDIYIFLISIVLLTLI